MKRRESERHGPVRALRRSVLVYCGAVCTEPDYFQGLNQALRHAGVSIKVMCAGVSPERLVRLASGVRDRRPGHYDQVWCVVDVDEFDIGAALAAASECGVNLAVSNPCFELWLLLHHADCRSYCAGYDDVATRLRKHVPTYDKSRLKFSHYAEGVAEAGERAKKLDPSGADHRRNPSTNVWQLVGKIMETS